MSFFLRHGDRRGRECMVVGFTATCENRAYHHYSCEFEPRSWRDVIDAWFSTGTPVSTTSETDRHDITEILLKVVLKTINQSKPNHLLGRK